MPTLLKILHLKPDLRLVVEALDDLPRSEFPMIGLHIERRGAADVTAASFQRTPAGFNVPRHLVPRLIEILQQLIADSEQETPNTENTDRTGAA